MTPNGPEPIFSSCSRDPSPCCGQAGTRQWCELKDIAVEDESRPNAWLNNVKRVPSTSYQPESKLPACLLNAIKPPETWRSCKTVLLRCTAGRSGENQASSNKNAKRCRQRWHGTRTRKSTSTVAVVPKVFTKTYRKHRSELSGERHPRPNPSPLHVARRSLLLPRLFN